MPLPTLLAAEVGIRVVKEAAEHAPSYGMAGVLYVSRSTGYLLLSVPNALMHGAFAALAEPGVELPPGPPGGAPSAHITVMSKEEVDAVGGPDKITERGRQFHYRIGGLTTLDNPEGWAAVARVWSIVCHAPELQALRRSYGLSSLPHGGEGVFHITVAVRRKAVLGRNTTAKGAPPSSAAA